MNILFLSNDGKLGDAVLHTALVRGIKNTYGDANIYCTTAGATTEFWRRDPRITESWPFWKLSFWQCIKLGFTIRKKKIDYIISWNPIKSEKLKLLTWIINPKHGVKIFVVNPDEHASIKEQRVLKLLNCPVDDVKYDIYPVEQDFSWHTNFIYLNLFASTKSRTISTMMAIDLLDKIADNSINNTIYLTHTDENKKTIDTILSKTKNSNVIAVNCTNNLAKLISLCQHAVLVLTAETAITHIASAFDKWQIAFFEEKNIPAKTSWYPKGNRHYLIDLYQDELKNTQSNQEVVSKIIELLK